MNHHLLLFHRHNRSELRDNAQLKERIFNKLFGVIFESCDTVTKTNAEISDFKFYQRTQVAQVLFDASHDSFWCNKVCLSFLWVQLKAVIT